MMTARWDGVLIILAPRSITNAIAAECSSQLHYEAKLRNEQ